MYWHGITETDGGKVLAVGVRIIAGKYQEFAGRCRSAPEAKANAMLVMWRQSRQSHGLPQEHVGRARVVTRLGALQRS